MQFINWNLVKCLCLMSCSHLTITSLTVYSALTTCTKILMNIWRSEGVIITVPCSRDWFQAQRWVLFLEIEALSRTGTCLLQYIFCTIKKQGRKMEFELEWVFFQEALWRLLCHDSWPSWKVLKAHTCKWKILSCSMSVWWVTLSSWQWGGLGSPL
jgi:hypothetical protein